MSVIQPSRKLIDLVNDWDDEAQHYQRINNRFQTSIKNLTSLNSQIWKQCQKEGIDISQFKLSARTELS